MKYHRFRSDFAVKLAAACCVLALSSCGHSPWAPWAPGGRLQVHVTENGVGPAPGKRIEIQGTSLSQTTDANGLALFIVRSGSYVVRAYDIGTPGPGLPFVDQTVEVEPARTSRAEFNDCTMCRLPSQ